MKANEKAILLRLARRRAGDLLRRRRLMRATRVDQVRRLADRAPSFSARADAFLAALPDFVREVNSLSGWPPATR